MAVQKPPDTPPRVALLGRVLGLPQRSRRGDRTGARRAGSRRPWSRPGGACAPAARRSAACSPRCSRPDRWSPPRRTAGSGADRRRTAAIAPCRPRRFSEGGPPKRLCGSIICRCRSIPFHARRWNRLVTGTIATAALNVVGLRNTDSSAISPPWLQPMMPTRDGSTSGIWSSARRPPSPHRRPRRRRSRSRRRAPARIRSRRDTPAR